MNTDPSPPDDFATLYRRAFQEHGARALWSTRLLEVPTPEDAGSPEITAAMFERYRKPPASAPPDVL